MHGSFQGSCFHASVHAKEAEQMGTEGVGVGSIGQWLRLQLEAVHWQGGRPCRSWAWGDCLPAGHVVSRLALSVAICANGATNFSLAK